MRELERYKGYYNANKLSYLMSENVNLREPFENRILRYDGNTREVEKLNIAKKLTQDDQATVDYLEERRKRILKTVKEQGIEFLKPEEIEDAIV